MALGVTGVAPRRHAAPAPPTHLTVGPLKLPWHRYRQLVAPSPRVPSHHPPPPNSAAAAAAAAAAASSALQIRLRSQSRSRPGGVQIVPPSLPSASTMPNRNKELEKEVMAWVEAVMGQKLPPGSFEDVFKDGVVLCNLINKIQPNSVKKIQTSGGSFKLMENIQRFQEAIKKYGVPHEEIFQTADLFERRNIPQVVLCLYSLGRITQKHPEYNGPSLGPKMADENKRDWDEDQQRQLRDGQIGLQMGQNKGASQSGMGSLNNTRHM